MNRKPLLVLVLTLLLALLSAAPAVAQETEMIPGVEAFDTPETDRLNTELAARQQAYDEAEARLAELEDYGGSLSDRSDARDALQEANDEWGPVAEDLAEAKLRAIQGAQVQGSEGQRIEQLRAKRDALTSLESFADDRLGITNDVTNQVESEIYQVDSDLAAVDAPEEGGGSSGGSSSGGSSSGAGGLLEAIGAGFIWIVSTVLLTAFYVPLVVAAMFGLAWRREGSAGVAWRATTRPSRLALAIGIAIALAFLGGLGFLALIALAVVLFFVRRRGGAGGSAADRARSPWAPSRGPGGQEEPDEGRRGRNVAGAKGEAKVNQILASLTGRSHCYVFANLWENGVGNIDHVLVGRAGLIIVETKANSGEAFLDEQGNLTAGGRPFSRDPFDQAARQLGAVCRRIGLPLDEGDYRVCLAAASGLRVAPGAPKAGRVLLIDDLARALTHLPENLSEREVDQLAERIMGLYGTAPIASPGGSASSGPMPGPTVGGSGDDGHSYLSRYTRDVTQEARDGLIDEAVGRADELEALVEILTRRKINNVVLTGEAGVGKTALVEELARKLVMGRVPPVLAGKELLELNVTALGAIQSVGDLGERLGGVLEELKAEPDRYILFVDEMHMLMGAGAHRDNPSGAADILKPALARGQVRMIGATTTDEFREIEKDPAMARRFGKVDIPPLTAEETVEVLRRTAPAEERHYGIRVEEGALTAAAKLADRYVTDQKLPGSAVAVLATACSGVALREENAVTAEAVARVVSRQTGVPLGSLNADERDRMANVEGDLKKRVVGQHEAVRAVATAIRRKRSGFGRGRPASFMFVGPTGVGKTELAKSLAEVLFGDEGAMIRLDMAEFHDKYTAARLVGSPPGYVGFDEGGQLTEPVRRRPYSVVLLDEIEKAHPQVLDPLLSVLDDGRLADSSGRVADFSEAVVILTSNLAADAVMRAWSVGQEVSEEQMAEELVARGIRPELVQRIGKIAVFEPPDPSDVKTIARTMLSKTARSMAEEHDIRVSFTDEAVDLLAERGYDPANGLRPLRRVIEREVEDRLSDLLFQDKIGRGASIVVDVRPDNTLGVRQAKVSR